jgi:hypothetical protein
LVVTATTKHCSIPVVAQRAEGNHAFLDHGGVLHPLAK